ncbi:MAG: ubiquinone biosynthesis regulatory protein kinase UbiB [Gammaproteobacteria bacterium]|nr:ubiquinone biosynthesis regulatory protein kinase UbiB [Gammaproteobacteria bacterium]
MISPKQLARLLHINYVLAKHGLDEIVLATHLFRPFHFILYLAPWNWIKRKRKPRGQRIREALIELGPIFIKFGQILSTRRDLLPNDIADELAHLQDRVPPFPSQQAIAIIEKAYKKPISELFDHFDETPLASASVAQVHSATLPDGSDVVVKVLRPGIENIIRKDVNLLGYIAKLAEHYWKDGKRLHPCEVVEEFKRTIFDELDLMREAANASQLYRNFSDSDLLYVPEIYWPYCKPNVIIMERIYGTPVSNISALKDNGIDLKRLSEQGVEIFFTQVFQHNFFHADMHPGNIFVSPQGQYIAIDFGIVGSLSDEDQQYLAGNFLAFFQRDYKRVAELHVESGWVPKGTRIEAFEAAIRTVCEPIFERPLKDISFGQLLLRLFQTARRFDMEVQPQLVLLQKTLLNIEGLGRQLYPDLDLWQTAKPFLEKWMYQRNSVSSIFKDVTKNLPELRDLLPKIPMLVHQSLENSAKLSEQLEDADQQIRELRNEIKRSNKRTISSILGTGLIISAALIFGLDGYSPRMIAGVPLLSWVLGGLGVAVLFLYTWDEEK